MKPTTHWHFHHLYTSSGWKRNVYLSTDSKGYIKDFHSQPLHSDYQTVIPPAIPSFINTHSHAFQYAMAGLTEWSPHSQDDFWSWRNKMYQLALQLNPDDIESVATALYLNLVKKGYSHVVEFHYLHHDQNGKPYDNPLEISHRLIAAALKVGIKITLIPIYYNQGGFSRPAEDHQRRFIIQNIDTYLQYYEELQRFYHNDPQVLIGLGPHSIRAVKKEELKELFQFKSQSPLHIHISEQKKEVEDCLQHYNQTPIEWLYPLFANRENVHLIHATHITNKEQTLLIDKNKISVVLCPSTEANLGDGLFPLSPYLKQHGSWSVGTDSHIGLCPFEELRWLEYGQRLRLHQRNPLTDTHTPYSGELLIQQSQVGGLMAAGKGSHFLKAGCPLDVLVLDGTNEFISNCPQEHWLSQWVFNQQSHGLKSHIINGQWIIKEDQHPLQESVSIQFRDTLKKLNH